MMKNLLLLLVVALFTTNFANAQSFHFKEGFGESPEGWELSNTYLTGSSSNVHNEFEGAKAVKMKGTESIVQTAAYATAAELSYWILPKAESTTLKVEKSTDGGTNWTELETFTPGAGDLDTYQNRKINVNDQSGSVSIKFTATGGSDGEGIFYLDDVSLTKMDAGSNVASLSDISINGASIDGFNEDSLHYDVTLFYTENVEISCVPNSSEASVEIIQPADIFGDETARTATINVTSKDGTNQLTYTVTVTISEYLFTTGFTVTGDGIMPGAGWEGAYTYTSTNIPGPGDHAQFEGEAAIKLIRGQADKQGYFKSPKYTKVKTFSFWMFIQEPDASASVKVEATTASGSTVLATLTQNDLATDQWKQFSYDINESDSVYFTFTPTLTTDGSTRIWIDDIAILADAKVTAVSEFKAGFINVYPNPVADKLTVKSNKALDRIAVYNINGQQVIGVVNPSPLEIIGMKNQPNGIYFVKMMSGSKVMVRKVIKN